MSTSRYQPSPFIRASLLLHAGAAAAAAAWPELWKVSTLAVAGNHAALTTFGLIPRSAILGHNITRLPDTDANRNAVAITIDDGPHPVATPKVLDILDEHGAKATFFCIGQQVFSTAGDHSFGPWRTLWGQWLMTVVAPKLLVKVLIEEAV